MCNRRRVTLVLVSEQARVDKFDELVASGQTLRSAPGEAELRVLLEPYDEDEDDSIKAIAGFSWRETAERVRLLGVCAVERFCWAGFFLHNEEGEQHWRNTL